MPVYSACVYLHGMSLQDCLPQPLPHKPFLLHTRAHRLPPWYKTRDKRGQVLPPPSWIRVGISVVINLVYSSAHSVHTSTSLSYYALTASNPRGKGVVL